MALHGAAWLAALFEEHDALADWAASLETLSQTHGFVFQHGAARLLQGCALAAQGRHADAEQAMAEGFQQEMQRHGGLLFHAFQAWKRGENLLAVRDDGLYHAGHYGHTLLHYREVRRMADMRGFLVIFVGSGYFHAVPYSAFASDEERKQFADLLQSKLEAAGKAHPIAQ